jgi:hypothetical protein
LIELAALSTLGNRRLPVVIKETLELHIAEDELFSTRRVLPRLDRPDEEARSIKQDQTREGGE